MYNLYYLDHMALMLSLAKCLLLFGGTCIYELFQSLDGYNLC